MLGGDFLNQYDEASQEGIDRRYQQAGQAGAKFGRLGSGMMVNDIEEIARGVERDRLSAAHGFHTDERDYRLRQRMSEEDLRNAEFGRNLSRAEFTARGKKQTAALTAAEQAAQRGRDAYGTTGDLLSRYAYERALERPA
jgi:hypothetical protein